MSYHISIDIGRSSVKYAASYNKKIVTGTFPSVFSLHDVRTQNSGITAFSDEKVLRKATFQVEGKSVTAHFGESALMVSREPMILTEGPAFIQSSLHIIYYVCALCSYELGLSGSRKPLSPSVSLNLTFSNHSYSTDFAPFLKDKSFSVDLECLSSSNQHVKKSFRFHTKDIYVFYQGYVSLFTVAFKKTSKGVSPVPSFKLPGVIVDIGRRTTDLTYVKDLSLVQGKSFDFGLDFLWEHIQDRLRAQNIDLPLADLEKLYFSGAKVGSALFSNEFITVPKYIKDHKLKENLIEEISSRIRLFASTNPVNWVLFTGGGSAFLEKELKRAFASSIFVKEPQFGNALGMLQFQQYFN